MLHNMDLYKKMIYIIMMHSCSKYDKYVGMVIENLEIWDNL